MKELLKVLFVLILLTLPVYEANNIEQNSAIAVGKTNSNCEENTDVKEKHPVDIKTHKCIEKCNYATACTAGCINAAQEDWLKEIDKDIAKLKKIMNKEEYEALQKSQKAWLEYKNAQVSLNEQTIGSMMGTMYLVVLAAMHDELLEKREKELSQLYNYYKHK